MQRGFQDVIARVELGVGGVEVVDVEAAAVQRFAALIRLADPQGIDAARPDGAAGDLDVEPRERESISTGGEEPRSDAGLTHVAELARVLDGLLPVELELH